METVTIKFSGILHAKYHHKISTFHILLHYPHTHKFHKIQSSGQEHANGLGPTLNHRNERPDSKRNNN
uniref:Uncharacterized protein n=1 Tax=Anopheles dirus TaxID=7168 RepID=A0A182NPH3_9DIPT